MKRNLSIGQKIWLSLSILIFGYFISMGYGVFIGLRTESRINGVSEFLLPATIQSQIALAAFKEQIKLYKDAVLVGEEQLIETAATKSRAAQVALSVIADLKGIGQDKKSTALNLKHKLEEFTESAKLTYTQMSENSDAFPEGNQFDAENLKDDLELMAIGLANETSDLRKQLTLFSENFTQNLNVELYTISVESHRHRVLIVTIFIAVVVIALSLISLIISRSISRPLKKTLILERAVDQSADGIAVTDLNGNIQFVNRAWLKMYKYANEEIIDKPLTFFFASEVLKQQMTPLIGMVDRDGIYQCEMEHLRKDSTVFPTIMTMSLIKNTEESPIGLVFTVKNVTEQKKNEEELKGAKEAAEAANIAKSDFVANMSHEIRTPMNGVIGMTSLLLDTSLTQEQREYAETIQYSADSLLSIINDILDFSKIEAGKMEIEMVDFDLRSLVEEVSEMLAIKAHKEGIEFACLIDDKVPPLLKGDPVRIRQVLMNLLGNAVKFTEQGEVVVRVFVVQETKKYATIRFNISDTGIGIPYEGKNKLFKSFSQIDPSRTRKYGGTGLGLAISKRLVDMMNGQINFVSEEGKGSTFWFIAKFEKREIGVKQILMLPQEIQKRRILAVDDNAINREVLGAYLDFWKCRYDLASGAHEALSMLYKALADNDPFDLAIIDHMMPHMDGEELCKEVKKDDRLKKLVMVMLTSSGIGSDSSQMIKIGYSAYLTKPIKRSQLFDCLMLVLGRKQPPIETAKIEKPAPEYTLTEIKEPSIRILLAEDNMVNQKLALRLLEKFGFRADAVTNGIEAIKALEMVIYDVVLMDVQMPEMDGLEATKIIRDKNSSVLAHDVPIIAMTAHAMKGDREKCLKAGMDDYISKPVKPDKLLEAIEKQLSVAFPQEYKSG